jgi:hypothetical protein
MENKILPAELQQGGFSGYFWKRITFLSPLLYAISPLLYSYTINITNYTPVDFLVSSVFFILAAIVVFALIALLILKFQKRHAQAGTLEQASLFTVFFLLLFYVLYSPANQLLKDLIGSGFQHSGNDNPWMIIGANKILFPVCLGLFIGSIVYIIRHKELIRPLNAFFRLTGIALIAISIIRLGSLYLYDGRNNSTSNSLPVQQSGSNQNIYYIILDAYSSFDVLKKYYGYDNDAFARYLTDHGFYVARKSRCNYPVTFLSLCSSLNMKYIPCGKKVATNDDQFVRRYNEIRESETATILLRHGYTYIPIGHTFFPEGFGKRRNIVSTKSYPKSHHLWFNQLSLTPFESLVSSWKVYFMERQRISVLFEFNLLEKSADYPGPKFVFAHITCPHPPYIFHRDGSFSSAIVPKSKNLSEKECIAIKNKMYIEQLEFVTQKAKQIIDHILARDSSAIIVLQSDHGTTLIDTFKQPHDYANDSNFIAQRMPILNAYRVPGEIKKSLYDSISPVNSFRIIFDKLFEMRAGTIPDSHFVVYWNNRHLIAGGDNIYP